MSFQEFFASVAGYGMPLQAKLDAVKAEFETKMAPTVNRRGNLTPYWRRILTPAWGIDPTAAERWCGASAVGSMVAEVRRGS